LGAKKYGVMAAMPENTAIIEETFANVGGQI